MFTTQNKVSKCILQSLCRMIVTTIYWEMKNILYMVLRVTGSPLYLHSTKISLFSFEELKSYIYACYQYLILEWVFSHLCSFIYIQLNYLHTLIDMACSFCFVSELLLKAQQDQSALQSTQQRLLVEHDWFPFYTGSQTTFDWFPY